MKNLKKITLLIGVLALSTVVSGKSSKILVAGSGWNKVAIFDRETGAITQTYDLPKESECNSIVKGYGNSIVYSYRKGVQAISLDGELLFDIKAGKNEEIQSVSLIKGGYLVGVCGTPNSRILELDRKGNITKDIKCELGVERPHAQHRQITKTDKGNYLVPVMAKKIIIEFDSNGDVVRKIDINGGVFGIDILKSGNWLIACGDQSRFLEFDPVSETVVKEVNSETIGDGIKLGFVAELIRMKNGNTLVCNWLGHTKNKEEPIVMELDENYKIVWKIAAGAEGIGAISAADLY